MVSMITAAQARIIEKECGLPEGSIAIDREITQAEEIYLASPDRPMLAFHVDYVAQQLALVIYDVEIGQNVREHLHGATFETETEAQEDAQRQWGAMVVARQSGLSTELGEDLAVSFTGWVTQEPGQRFSWSCPPQNVRNLFSYAPRPMLLLPKFADVPPPKTDDDSGPSESPGKCIQDIAVGAVIYVHSILYQGTSTLQHRDASGLLKLAQKNKEVILKGNGG